MNRISPRLKEIAPLLKAAFTSWQDDKAPRMGAALAYYIALSLAPSLLILLAVVEWLFGAQTAAGRLVSQIRKLVGEQGAEAVRTMMRSAHQPYSGVSATLVGLVTVFFAGSAVVSELRDAMNTIWKVPGDDGSGEARDLMNLIEDRVLSFALVLASGLFLLASLTLDAWIFAVRRFLDPSAFLPLAVIHIVDWFVSLVVITSLFAFIFKVLPRVPLLWSDVVPGAVGTSLLFVTGKLLLGVYLGMANFADTYGAAGSLVVVLVWVYYSAQVLYLGAEVTRAYTLRLGSMLAPGVSRTGV
jgi:membrane protein